MLTVAPVVALACATVSASAASASTLQVGAVPVAASVDIRLTDGASVPGGSAWRREGDSFLLTDDDRRVLATVRATQAGDGAWQVGIRLEYREEVAVVREALVLRLPGKATVLGRDLRVVPLSRPLRVDRGTPVWVATTSVALVGGEGLVAARTVPHAGGVDVELILDDVAAHPFRTCSQCVAHTGRSKPSVAHDRIERRRGDVIAAQVTLYPRAEFASLAPLIVERWPKGAGAAMVFVDHADRTDPAALRAVLYGASARMSPRYGRAGFFGRGLKITKTFFDHGGVGALADDPEAATLAHEIMAHGSEVGVHSVSPERDDRPKVAAGLADFAALGPVTWVDHQPDTNCEAITNEGWSSNPVFGTTDLLAAAGIRWVWGARDLRGVLNLFEPERADEARPPIYPLPSEPRLWVFDSIWFYDTPARLAARLGDVPLERLRRERGLFVGHTYLSASPRTTKRSSWLRRDVVRALPGGGYEIDSAFDAALARVADGVGKGQLASLSWREAGDRLRALQAVRLRYLGDGRVRVTNAGYEDLVGLTVAVPVEATWRIEGAEFAGSRDEPGRATAWFDLPAGATVVIAWHGGTP